VLSRLDSEHIIKYYDSFLEQVCAGVVRWNSTCSCDRQQQPQQQSSTQSARYHPWKQYRHNKQL
jgi:hypothetical protein